MHWHATTAATPALRCSRGLTVSTAERCPVARPPMLSRLGIEVGTQFLDFSIHDFEKIENRYDDLPAAGRREGRLPEGANVFPVHDVAFNFRLAHGNTWKDAGLQKLNGGVAPNQGMFGI